MCIYIYVHVRNTCWLLKELAASVSSYKYKKISWVLEKKRKSLNFFSKSPLTKYLISKQKTLPTPRAALINWVLPTLMYHSWALSTDTSGLTWWRCQGVNALLIFWGHGQIPCLVRNPDKLIGSMGLVYLPTFTIKINQTEGKYAIQNPIGRGM